MIKKLKQLFALLVIVAVTQTLVKASDRECICGIFETSITIVNESDYFVTLSKLKQYSFCKNLPDGILFNSNNEIYERVTNPSELDSIAPHSTAIFVSENWTSGVDVILPPDSMDKERLSTYRSNDYHDTDGFFIEQNIFEDDRTPREKVFKAKVNTYGRTASLSFSLEKNSDSIFDMDIHIIPPHYTKPNHYQERFYNKKDVSVEVIKIKQREVGVLFFDYEKSYDIKLRNFKIIINSTKSQSEL